MGQVVQGRGNSGALHRLSAYQSFVPSDCQGNVSCCRFRSVGNGLLFDNS